MLAHNRKCEVLNFLITIHRLSQTGEWIKSKRINPNSAHYQNYMMQQNQYQNFMPYMNPSMFLNQSMQYANQPMMNLDASMNRQFAPQLTVQSEPQNKLTPSPRSDKKPDNFLAERASLVGFDHINRGSQNFDEIRGSRGSLTKHYDTVNEQVPLPKPKHDYEDEAIQTRFEFGNVDFNANNNFKLGTTTKNPRAKSKDKSFDEVPVCIITGGLGGGSGGGAGGEEVHLDLFDDPFPTKKPKPKKKKDLKEKRKFLKKRQKYDPRKAIEKEKQRKIKKSKKKGKSAFPKGFFKNENGGEDISETEEEPQESNEKSSESETEPEPEPKKRLTQKEVKIRKESRSEKRKTRVTTKPVKVSKPQPPVKDESDEGSPERRLDSTPKKKEKKNKKIVKVEKPKQINDKQISDKHISDRKVPSAAKVKSKNVQFQKLNWGKVQRKIDCWKNVPPPPQPENEEEEEVTEIIEKTPERLQQRPVETKKIQRPVAVKNLNLASDEMEPEETRLIMSLDKEGEEIEIIEMNEDEIPYKKVVVRKGDQDQYDIQVYEEGEDHIRNDDFTDDYDSEELSVPEEREADEYVYSEQKNNDQEESEEFANQQQQNEQSYYSDEDSANILPLNIDELDNLHEEVHGLNTEIQI
jgi:hypothetical protein